MLSYGAAINMVVNPARAGMIPVSVTARVMLMGKPRASGDDPYR